MWPEWRVYTSSGVFTSGERTPWTVPRQDVQVIVQSHPENDYEIVHSKDYYYWEPARGNWQGSDIFGMYDHLIRAEKPLVLFGRMLSDPDWRALFERVKLDCGPRTGRLNREPLREPYT
jgi:hypothetical protein